MYLSDSVLDRIRIVGRERSVNGCTEKVWLLPSFVLLRWYFLTAGLLGRGVLFHPPLISQQLRTSENEILISENI